MQLTWHCKQWTILNILLFMCVYVRKQMFRGIQLCFALLVMKMSSDVSGLFVYEHKVQICLSLSAFALPKAVGLATELLPVPTGFCLHSREKVSLLMQQCSCFYSHRKGIIAQNTELGLYLNTGILYILHHYFFFCCCRFSQFKFSHCADFLNFISSEVISL